MKQAGKVLAVIIVLFIIAGAVFYIGWTQFSVKPGYCGVFISKTGGIDTDPVLPGVFSWKWERLLPTNSEIRIFELKPYAVSKTISGSLPSADIYQTQIKENPDFSYSLTYSITITMTPQGIINLVRTANIKDNSALSAYLSSAADRAAQAATSWILSQASSESAFIPGAADSKAILTGIAADKNFSDVEFSSFTVTSSKIPDMKMYELAKKSYTLYRQEIDSALAEQAKTEAENIASEDRLMSRLEKLGELLEKYPSLSPFLKGENMQETLKSLEINN
ncbi:MAG: hypothetical protein LKF96_09710 [Treponema sp.]|jgi:hypothetical protein|nr:hypothetical protein [Treponema sp.]